MAMRDCRNCGSKYLFNVDIYITMLHYFFGDLYVCSNDILHLLFVLIAR